MPHRFVVIVVCREPIVILAGIFRNGIGFFSRRASPIHTRGTHKMEAVGPGRRGEPAGCWKRTSLTRDEKLKRFCVRQTKKIIL